MNLLLSHMLLALKISPKPVRPVHNFLRFCFYISVTIKLLIQAPAFYWNKWPGPPGLYWRPGF